MQVAYAPPPFHSNLQCYPQPHDDPDRCGLHCTLPPPPLNGPFHQLPCICCIASMAPQPCSHFLQRQQAWQWQGPVTDDCAATGTSSPSLTPSGTESRTLSNTGVYSATRFSLLCMSSTPLIIVHSDPLKVVAVGSGPLSPEEEGMAILDARFRTVAGQCGSGYCQ